MRLEALLPPLPAWELRGDAGVEVGGIAYDSRRVAPGDLFVCLRGLKDDGHRHAPAAAAAGAAALVVEEWLDLPLPQVRVPDTRRAMRILARTFYGDPAAQLGLVGVTGTNGKTTTTYFIRSILEAAGGDAPWDGSARRPVALIGTVQNIIGSQVQSAAMTTPEAPDLVRLFREAVDAGCRWLVMEVSSHALALDRVDPADFAAAVVTNVTRDHFDFHGDFAHYLEAKARLFSCLATPRVPGRPGVAAINLDDEGARMVLDRCPVPPVTYGLRPEADVQAREIAEAPAGARFELVLPGATPFPVQLRVPGRFNVYNALAAAAVAWRLGVPPAAIRAGLEAMPGVPGRAEPVDVGQDFQVLVDFAHNPGALENILTLRPPDPAGRVILVFGAEGGKDPGKRPEMGRVARRADYVIVTSDNVYGEDPLSVAQQVAAPLAGHPHEIILDRRAAIARALALARPGDLVIVAGKGHEQTWVVNGRKIPFDDRQVVRELLAERLGVQG